MITIERGDNMTVNKIKDDVISLRSLDWDRRLFDELIPLPDGTTYNAYLIKGSNKNALIDTTYPEKSTNLETDLKDLEINSLDYIIANHAEPDHSGTISRVIERFPEAKIVCTKKGKNILQDLLLISENKFKTVEDNEEISLGDKTLRFIEFPWVHWPETMVTYLTEDKILFPCDLFGSHLAQSNLFVDNESKVHEAAKRYYAEIMMPFRKIIKRNMGKITGLDLDVIAPSHGPVYQKPQFIINAYQEWLADQVKDEVIIPYISMYGSTEKMVNYVIERLIENDIKVKPFNITKTDLGELAKSLVDAATIIIGSPTVLTGPHPKIQYIINVANALRPKTRFASVIGSYGWGGNMVEKIKNSISNLDVELIEPVLIKGKPDTEDYEDIDELVQNIIQKHEKIKN